MGQGNRLMEEWAEGTWSATLLCVNLPVLQITGEIGTS